VIVADDQILIGYAITDDRKDESEMIEGAHHAAEYLNSRFHFNRSNTFLETFERVRKIKLGTEEGAVADFTLWMLDGIVPRYLEEWVEQGARDESHFPTKKIPF
jgi:hypothetical protein